MIEVKFEDNCEVANLAWRSVAEARGLYQSEFGIAEKAVAVLNGRKIRSAAEPFTILMDDDNLVFKTMKGNKAIFLVGSLLLALAVTGGAFASSVTNSTAVINAGIAEHDFAIVTSNSSSLPSWIAHGLQKNQTGSGTLFDIDTQTSGYAGDLVATVTLTNVDSLIKVYRNLTLSIEVRDSADNLMDINSDDISDTNDFILLTLENSQVQLNIKQNAASMYNINLRSGYYICNLASNSWASIDGAPILYCDVAQR